MDKLLSSYLLLFFLLGSASSALCDPEITEKEVLNLIDFTAKAIEKDALHTFKQINNGTHPFKDKARPTLYVFVYDTNVTGIAHFHNPLVGLNFKGKGDVFGKKFHDEIVTGGLTKGSGHVVYTFAMPGKKGRRYKKTFYKLVTGSNKKQYVVCCGIYLGVRMNDAGKNVE